MKTVIVFTASKQLSIVCNCSTITVSSKPKRETVSRNHPPTLAEWPLCQSAFLSNSRASRIAQLNRQPSGPKEPRLLHQCQLVALTLAEGFQDWCYADRQGISIPSRHQSRPKNRQNCKCGVTILPRCSQQETDNVWQEKQRACPFKATKVSGCVV